MNVFGPQAMHNQNHHNHNYNGHKNNHNYDHNHKLDHPNHNPPLPSPQSRAIDSFERVSSPLIPEVSDKSGGFPGIEEKSTERVERGVVMSEKALLQQFLSMCSVEHQERLFMETLRVR